MTFTLKLEHVKSCVKGCWGDPLCTMDCLAKALNVEEFARREELRRELLREYKCLEEVRENYSKGMELMLDYYDDLSWENVVKVALLIGLPLAIKIFVSGRRASDK